MDPSERAHVVVSDARGQRARQAARARRGGSPAIGAAKRLALWVGLAVLAILLGSCAAGYAIVSSGGKPVLAAVRDVGVLILVPLYLLQALIWAGLYFALAWATGVYGPKLPAALRWTAGKVALVNTQLGRNSDRFVVRPLAQTVRRVTEARVLVSRITSDVAGTTAPVRRVTREVSDWPTLQHRLRWSRRALPVDGEGVEAER